MRRSAPILLLALAACSYQSRYSAPLDGRPRAVWLDGDVVADFAGAGLSPQCATAIAHAIDNGSFPAANEELDFDADLRDRLLQYAVFVRPPDERYAPGWVGVHLAYSGSFQAGTTASSQGSLTQGSPSTGGGGGGDKAAAVLAIITILLLGPIDMYVSLAPPEDSTLAAESIDLVNAYNEAVRRELPECIYVRRGPR